MCELETRSDMAKGDKAKGERAWDERETGYQLHLVSIHESKITKRPIASN